MAEVLVAERDSPSPLATNTGASGVRFPPVIPVLVESDLGPPFRRRWTRDEYYRMADAGVLAPDERTELIQGEIIAMCPQNAPHSTACRRANKRLEAIFREGYDVRPQLPLAVGGDSDPEPDLAVVEGSPEDYAEAHPRTAVLLVEVADTTLAYDRTTKASLYAAAGIRDYWVVNLVDHLVEVHRDPQQDSMSPTGSSYGQVSRYGRGATIAPLAAPGAQIAVDHVLPPLKK